MCGCVASTHWMHCMLASTYFTSPSAHALPHGARGTGPPGPPQAHRKSRRMLQMLDVSDVRCCYGFCSANPVRAATEGKWQTRADLLWAVPEWARWRPIWTRSQRERTVRVLHTAGFPSPCANAYSVLAFHERISRPECILRMVRCTQ